MQHRLQKFIGQFVPIACEWTHQAPISTRIAMELLRRTLDISMQARRSSVVERMCQRNFGLDPLKTESFQRKRVEKW